MSGDSKSLYVAVRDDDAIAGFRRDTDTGDLTYDGCITAELPTVGACTQLPGATADGFDSGFDSPRAVVVSADESSLYAASRGDDAVSHFTRASDSGALAYRGCITSAEANSGPSGSGACDAIPGATASGADSGLDSLFELALSPDANSLYAASRYDAALATFDRESASTLPDPLPGPVLDRAAPALTLGGRKKQKSTRVVKVKVSCDEACAATGSGRIKVPVVAGSAKFATSKKSKLKPQTKEIAAGDTVTLKLRLKRKARKLARRAQMTGKKARAKVTVRVADAAGNEASDKRRFKLGK
jgi:hypothetical protein